MKIGYLSTLYHTSHILKSRGAVKGEWKIFGTGMEIIKAFERGLIDLAYVGLTPVIFAVDKGIDIVCISGGHVEGTVIAGRFDGEFPESLEGRRIGVPSKGSIHDVILRSFLDRVDFEVVNYPWAEMILDDFIDRKLDGVCGTPNLAVLSSKYGARIIAHPSEIWPWNPSYGIAVRKDFLEENKEIILDFLIKHEWATNLLREARKYSSRILFEYIREEIGLKEIEEILSLSPKYCASLPEEYVNSTMSLSKVMMKLGYIDSTFKKQEIFDLTIIREIHPQKEHYTQFQP